MLPFSKPIRRFWKTRRTEILLLTESAGKRSMQNMQQLWRANILSGCCPAWRMRIPGNGRPMSGM